MESNNNFSNGMNIDTSKVYQTNNEYLEAYNFRPVTQKGGSNNALVNIKGNQQQVQFPNIRGVYRLKLVNNPGTTSTETLTINGQSTSIFTINDATTTQDIYNEIILLSNCVKNLSAVNPTFDVAFNGDYIAIYQLTTFVTGITTNSTEPLIVITQNTGGPTDSQLYFVDINNLTTLTYTPNTPGYVGNELIIIGSTFINETFYILTCPYNNPSNVGQIWEMSYDEVTKVTTLILLFNGLLNFQKEFPIAPSAIKGRYELSQIQRIYWTDFNNPVRSVNAKEPNLMAFTIDLINLRPSIEMSIPVLEQIVDGGAVSPINCDSTYQCAYRLVKNNGAITNYSELSNLVTPISPRTDFFSKFQPNFTSMVGSTGTINKAIKWEVAGIDTNFDIIEFVIVIRTAPNASLFDVFKFDSQLINGRETISTTFVNDPATNDPITLDEFLIENTIFTHCKTLEEKDNRLFFANVSNDIDKALENYDTRTYRFKASTNDIKLKKFEVDTTATTYTITNPNTDYLTIPERADLIPLINLGMSTNQDPIFTKDYRYKRNSTIIGGEGPNISYSFGNILIRSDDTVSYPTQQGAGATNEGTDRDSTSSNIYHHGYRRAGGVNGTYTGLVPAFSNNSPNQTYRMNDTRLTMGIEYLSGLFRTGQRNEIYRYGILFKSRTNETSFVKWIGDIKFPDYSDLADPSLLGMTDTAQTCLDFRSMYYDGSSAYSVIPYINFEVSIPSDLANSISGYEIVICERKENDKTIHSQGVVTQVCTGPPTDPGNYYLPFSHYLVGNGLGQDCNLNACDPSSLNIIPFARASKDIIAYHSLDDLVSQSTTSYEEDDEIILEETYEHVIDNAITPGPTPVGDLTERYYIKKYYNLGNFIYKQTAVPSIHKLKEAYYVGQGNSSPAISTVGGAIYVNNDWDITGNHHAFAIGNPTTIVGIKNSSFDWELYRTSGFGVVSTPATMSTGAAQGNAKFLGVHFRPSKLRTQYGGRTYSNRATSTYISTGTFYPVNEPITTSIKVFGGDIFCGVLDTQKAIKNWFGPQPDGLYPNIKHSQTWYFPHQSTINVDLRDGYHVNADLEADDGTKASGNDQYNYIFSYSYPNNLKTYVSKPLFFNDTNTWINRVYWSDVKINGENNDSWTSIPALNYHEVEGGYGGINALIILNNNMNFVQDRAFGVLLINPYSIINDNNGQPLNLAIGSDVLKKHNYYSVDVGSKHQWSVYRSNSAISFVDSRHKKIYLFNGESLDPISDTKGNRGYLNRFLYDDILDSDNPILERGILTTYDYINNEFLYTFLNTASEGNPDQKHTLVFSDLINKFTGFYNFTPYIYINNHNKLFSPTSYELNQDYGVSRIFLHNVGDYCTFYDELFPSTLKVNINDNPKYTKIFDNLSWISDAIKEDNDVNNEIPYLNDTFNSIRCYNEYQNTDYNIISPLLPFKNIRKLEQQWNVQMFRNKVNYDTTNINTKSIFDPTILTKTTFGERMRDKFLVVDLTYDNGLNNRFIIHNLSSTYRISDR